jgi:hypothetical protein
MSPFGTSLPSGRKPIGEIVEGICKVLGLKFDPALWEDEPWGIEQARTKPAGSPFADWLDSANDDDEADADDEADPYGIATGTGPR